MKIKTFAWLRSWWTLSAVLWTGEIVYSVLSNHTLVSAIIVSVLWIFGFFALTLGCAADVRRDRAKTLDEFLVKNGIEPLGDELGATPLDYRKRPHSEN